MAIFLLGGYREVTGFGGTGILQTRDGYRRTTCYNRLILPVIAVNRPRDTVDGS